VTLQDPDTDIEPNEGSTAPVEFLPDGGLRVSVRTVAEAREALVALQRRQNDLLAAAANTAGSGVSTVHRTVTAGIVSGPRRLRTGGHRVVRRLGIRNRGRRVGNAVSDSLDVLSVSGQAAEGVVASVRLIGAAAHAIADAMPEIDLSDFDFPDLNL
jgi:hypothetical protein